MPDESVVLGELADEFTAHVRAGHAPAVEDYARRHPDLAERIRRLFPTLLMLEGLAGGGDAGALGQAGEITAGSSFGPYRIVRELGRGGMGVVYEAVHLPLDKTVALKVLPLLGPRSPTQLERFLREAKTAAGLHHTNIVPVFDIGQLRGTPYYAMQYIDGRGLDRGLRPEDLLPPAATTDLAATMDHQAQASGSSPSPLVGEGRGGGASLQRPSPPPQPSPIKEEGARRPSPSIEPAFFKHIADLGIQAAEALAYAHQRGVIHRDIKPSNLLLDKRGVLWITDFGLARRLDDDPGLTHSGAILGTPRYMSPEQAEAAKRPIDHRTDIYSLGVTLYELLTCRPAFDGKTPQEVVSQIISRDPVHPRSLNPAVPRDLETVVLKAMAKRPEDRYQQAADLAEDLRRWQRVEPIRARRIGPVGRTIRWCQRNPRLAAALAVIFAITVGYSILLQLQWHETLRVYQLEQAANDRLREKEAEVRHRFVRQLIANGERLLDQDDALGASTWFAEALRVDHEAGADLEMHRLRLGNVLRSRPRLVHCWFHKDYVSRSAFSPDGKRALTICQNELRLWDVATGEPISTPLLHAEHVWNAWFSPDGNSVLALALPGNLPGGDTPYDGEARMYDAATGKLVFPALKLTRLDGWVGAFTPDSKRFLVAAGKQVQVFDAVTGQPAYQPLDHTEKVSQAAFCPLGKRILTCAQFWVDSGTPETRLWDAATGKALMPPLKRMTATAKHAFSQDGNRFVVYEPEQRREGYLLEPRKTIIYDSATGQHGGSYETEGFMRAAAFSPDGRFLVMTHNRIEYKDLGFSAGDPNTTVIKVYDLRTGLRKADQELPGKEVEFTFSPDSRRLLASGRQFRIWHLSASDQVLTPEDLPAGDPARDGHFTRFSPCGRWLLGVGYSGGGGGGEDRLILLDTVERHSYWLWIPHRYGTITADFSPDGRYLLTHGHDGTARVWDLAGMGPAVKSFPGQLQDGVTHVVPSPDSRRIAFAHGNSDMSQDRGGAQPAGGVHFWDASTQQLAEPTIAYPGRIDRLAFRPDGSSLVGTTQFGEAVVWDVRTGKFLFKVGQPAGHPEKPAGQAVRQAVFSRDASQLITLMDDGSVCRWNANDGQAAAPAPLGRFPGAVLSASGRRLFAPVSPEVACIYDVDTGELLTRLPRMTGGIQHAAFSDDSRRLVVRTSDSIARIWDVDTGRLLSPVIHDVDDAAFSPDGRLLLTSRGGFTRCWDAATGEPITGRMHTMGLIHALGRASNTGFGTDSRTLLAPALEALRLWELALDARPVEELVLLAQVLSGHRIDPIGGYVPLHREELEQAWQKLRDAQQVAQRAAGFRPAGASVRQWREREAWEAEREADDLRARRQSEDAAKITSQELSFWFAVEVHMNHLIAGHPENAGYRASRAKARGELGRLKEALADYSEAMTLGRMDRHVAYARSMLHFKLGDQAQASEDFAKAIELGFNQNEAEAPWQWRAVIVGLARYMEKKPNEAALHIKRGDAYMMLDEWANAITDYSRAIELGVNKDYHDVWEQRGVAYQELKQWDKAIADYTKAIEIRPKWGDNYDTRAQCYAELKQFDKAEADFLKAVECGDDEGEFLYHLMLFHLSQGNERTYRHLLPKMLKRYPEPIYYGTIANLAWAHALVPDGTSDWQPLLDLLKAGQENLDGHKRKDYHFTRTRGATLYRAGKYEEAIGFLRQAVETQKEPKPVTAWLFLAMAEHQRGKAAEAKKWLDQAAATTHVRWLDSVLTELLLREAREVVK